MRRGALCDGLADGSGIEASLRDRPGRVASPIVGSRRLSEAIAEGGGISLLVDAGDPAAGTTALRGAGGLVLRAPGGMPAEDAGLPVLAYGPSPEDAATAGADAVVLPAGSAEDELAALAERAAALGLECVIHVSAEHDLERVLERLDPEILLLSAEEAEDDQGPLERLLQLLPDVPAGKLAIADLAHASRADVEELERAGVDAVVVAGNVEELAGDDVPEV